MTFRQINISREPWLIQRRISFLIHHFLKFRDCFQLVLIYEIAYHPLDTTHNQMFQVYFYFFTENLFNSLWFVYFKQKFLNFFMSYVKHKVENVFNSMRQISKLFFDLFNPANCIGGANFPYGIFFQFDQTFELLHIAF